MNANILVEIPALDGMTEGATLLMPSKWHGDYIGTYSLSAKLPHSETTLPAVKADSLATLVTEYFRLSSQAWQKSCQKNDHDP